MPAFDAMLAAVKAAEVKETAALVVQDKNLQRVLAVWPAVRRDSTGKVNHDGDEWQALWAQVGFDERMFIELTGLSTGVARVSIRRALTLKLIYPDGTIHSVARAVLQKAIKDALGV